MAFGVKTIEAKAWQTPTNAPESGGINTNNIQAPCISKGLFFMSFFKNNPLGKMIEKAKKLDEAAVWIKVVSLKTTQEFIVKLNTTQLKDGFMNSKGQLLSEIGGNYSPFTVIEGNKKGPASVDLFDKGRFHGSFRVENVRKTSFELNSDPLTDDGTNLLDEWGEDVEGLTFESIDKLVFFLIPLYQNHVKKELGL